MASGVISSLRAQQTEIMRKLAEMQPLPSQHDTARRPEAIRAEEGLRAIQGQITAEEDRIIANLENDYAASRNNVIALKEQLKKLTGAGGVVNPDGQAKLREAQRVANANRQVYNSFLNKFKELEQSQTMQEAEGRIIESAHANTSEFSSADALHNGVSRSRTGARPRRRFRCRVFDLRPDAIDVCHSNAA